MSDPAKGLVRVVQGVRLDGSEAWTVEVKCGGVWCFTNAMELHRDAAMHYASGLRYAIRAAARKGAK